MGAALAMAARFAFVDCLGLVAMVNGVVVLPRSRQSHVPRLRGRVRGRCARLP